MTDRKLWTAQEDDYITKLVSRYGTKKWPLISQKLCQETEFDRTGKQCRQRWYNHLNPDINTTRWSQEDEQRLFEAHKQFGNRWKQISKLFLGRQQQAQVGLTILLKIISIRPSDAAQEGSTNYKMRTLKPYVLSKILADKNMTEVILQLGKIKPNKANIDMRGGYMMEFNSMINKLYQINEEYQRVKGMRKRREGNGAEESDEDSQSDQEKDRSGEIQEGSQRQIRQEKFKQFKKIQKIDKMQQQGSASPKKTPTKTPIKKVVLLSPIKASDLINHIPVLVHPLKRSRKQVNYQKLNQGILCESERQENVDETNHSINLIPKRGIIQQLGQQEQQQRLEEIAEQEEKQTQKDVYINRSFFSHDFMDSRGISPMDIAHPSPSYGRSLPSFQDLIIVGTRIHQSPGEHLEMRQCEMERKRSQQQFIQQILQINFDPDEVLRELPEEQEED